MASKYSYVKKYRIRKRIEGWHNSCNYEKLLSTLDLNQLHGLKEYIASQKISKESTSKLSLVVAEIIRRTHKKVAKANSNHLLKRKALKHKNRL